MSTPTPLLDFFRSGEAARDVRLEAARGALAPRAGEQIEILLLLLDDADQEIRDTAGLTLAQIPEPLVRQFLSRPDVSERVRAAFARRGLTAGQAPPATSDEPLVDVEPMPDGADATSGETAGEEAAGRESVAQRVTKMSFPERLKAAVKGSREMRALLIRDPNKTISAAVLSSPKLTESEVEGFARMANLPEETLRIIGTNRAWTKNYGVIVGLAKNPKTPLAMSLNFMARLNDRDLQMLSIDRNVPDPLRVAARKRIVAATSRK